MTTPPPSEGLSPAERRLVEHLEIVRDSPPEADHLALAVPVVRRARWQRSLREPLQLIGRIATAVVGGLAGLLGARGGRPR